MPQYTVSAPDGRTLTFVGDTPPSGDVIKRAFEQAGGSGDQQDVSKIELKPSKKGLPKSLRKAEGYDTLTNQDLKNISDSWTTSLPVSATLGAANSFLFNVPSYLISAGLGALGAKETAETVRAWSKIQEEEHPIANLLGGLAGATAATVASGGAAAPAVAGAIGTAGKVSKGAKIAKGAAKVLDTPIAIAKEASKRVLPKTTAKLAEGGVIARTGGKMIKGAVEGGTIGAEYLLAQGAGVGLNQVAGAISAENAGKEYAKLRDNAPGAIAAGAVLGGSLPAVIETARQGGKLAKNTSDYVRGKIRLRQKEIDTFQEVVGKDALTNARAAMQSVNEATELELSRLQEGSEEYNALQQRGQQEAANAFWTTLMKSVDPEKAAILREQVRKDPKLQAKMSEYFTPVARRVGDEISTVTNRDYAILSDEINSRLDNNYTGPEGVVKNLEKDDVMAKFGKGRLMEKQRQDLYDQGLDELQAKIDAERELTSGDDLFSFVPKDQTFKGRSKAILNSAAQVGGDTQKIADKVQLDAIPSLKPGMPARQALEAKIESDWEKSLRHDAHEAVDMAAQQGKMSVEEIQAAEERMYQELKKQRAPMKEQYILGRRRTAQMNWLNDIMQNGTDDVRDLNHLKDVAHRALEKDIEAGEATTWGRASKQINNLFREFDGQQGKMTHALNADKMAADMSEMWDLGFRYGKGGGGAGDKRALQKLLKQIELNTPDPTGDAAIYDMSVRGDIATGLSVFKAGVLKQAEELAKNGDIQGLINLRDVMSATGGSGLGEFFTKGELANTFNNLVPLARAAKNTEAILKAADAVGSTNDKSWIQPLIRLTVSTLTGGRNTAMNALVTLLDRGQWGPKTADAIAKIAENPTAQAWNELLGTVSKDTAARKQFGRMLLMGLQAQQTRLGAIPAQDMGIYQ